MNIRSFLGLNYYTSALDEFLNDFDRSYPKLSIARHKEMEKYNRIYALRDNPNETHPKDTSFWENF